MYHSALGIGAHTREKWLGDTINKYAQRLGGMAGVLEFVEELLNFLSLRVRVIEPKVKSLFSAFISFTEAPAR